jgi:hypothetical protein
MSGIIPPFARTVSLYAKPYFAKVTPRWLKPGQKGIDVVVRRPQLPASEKMEAELEAHYKMPAAHYLLSGSLAVACGWQITNRAIHEWPMQFGVYSVYFPAHH